MFKRNIGPPTWLGAFYYYHTYLFLYFLLIYFFFKFTCIVTGQKLHSFLNFQSGLMVSLMHLVAVISVSSNITNLAQKSWKKNDLLLMPGLHNNYYPKKKQIKFSWEVFWCNLHFNINGYQRMSFQFIQHSRTSAKCTSKFLILCF